MKRTSMNYEITSRGQIRYDKNYISSKPRSPTNSKHKKIIAPRCIIIKLLKINSKGKILKAFREKENFTCKRTYNSEVKDQYFIKHHRPLCKNIGRKLIIMYLDEDK